MLSRTKQKTNMILYVLYDPTIRKNNWRVGFYRQLSNWTKRRRRTQWSSCFRMTLLMILRLNLIMTTALLFYRIVSAFLKVKISFYLFCVNKRIINNSVFVERIITIYCQKYQDRKYMAFKSKNTSRHEKSFFLSLEEFYGSILYLGWLWKRFTMGKVFWKLRASGFECEKPGIQGCSTSQYGTGAP